VKLAQEVLYSRDPFVYMPRGWFVTVDSFSVAKRLENHIIFAAQLGRVMAVDRCWNLPRDKRLASSEDRMPIQGRYGRQSVRSVLLGKHRELKEHFC
jgi:hypothetical protein